MFCSKCGKELKEGENFCTKCGEKIGNSGNILDFKLTRLIVFVLVIGLIILFIHSISRDAQKTMDDAYQREYNKSLKEQQT